MRYSALIFAIVVSLYFPLFLTGRKGIFFFNVRTVKVIRIRQKKKGFIFKIKMSVTRNLTKSYYEVDSEVLKISADGGMNHSFA